jgi:hypothetical protein
MLKKIKSQLTISTTLTKKTDEEHDLAILCVGPLESMLAIFKEAEFNCSAKHCSFAENAEKAFNVEFSQLHNALEKAEKTITTTLGSAVKVLL